MFRRPALTLSSPPLMSSFRRLFHDVIRPWNISTNRWNISTNRSGCKSFCFYIRDFKNKTVRTLIGKNILRSDDVKNKPSNKGHQIGRISICYVRDNDLVLQSPSRLAERHQESMGKKIFSRWRRRGKYTTMVRRSII